MYIHLYIRYEWDHSKNRANIRKHGIDFADIPPVFDRPMLIEPDEREQYGEDRWIGLGMFPNGIEVVVVFAESTKESTRIISARRATQKERKRYHEEIEY